MFFKPPYFLAVLTLLVSASHGLIHTRFADLPRRDFDFIIVGGGTAGSALANRLSERRDFSVLLLEAGPSHDDAYLTQVPYLAPRLRGGPYDWGYSTAPQTSMNNRIVQYPRGFVLGGSSSINSMLYTRCSAEDYDRYADVTGDQGWSWNRLQPYIRKNERWSDPVDNSDTTGKYNPRVHSTTGITAVSLNSFPWATDSIIRQASRELPREFPFNLDMNSGNELGFGWGQYTIRDGARESSATSYLADRYVRRPNLSVLINARVTRLLKTGQASRGPIVRGVVFTQDGGATTVTLRARNEVILSAGSVGTPAILLHSGIGNFTTLRSLGIPAPLLVNLPSVGQNLTDHPLSTISWRVNSTSTQENISRNPAVASEAEREWNRTHTGPLSSISSSQLGFFRIPTSNPIFGGARDPAAGPNTPHYELIPINGAVGPAPEDNFFSMILAAVQPTARGSVTITSTDPLAAPRIDPNLLSTSFDIGTMREAVLAARRLVRAPVFRSYILSEASGIGNTTTEIDAYLRRSTGIVFHPTGTAMMTRKGAKYGVVDPDLRVKGAAGLRVVDASVFPFIPAGHTQVPVYIFAERASDMIKAAN